MLLRFGTDVETVVADMSYVDTVDAYGADVGPGGLRKPFFWVSTGSKLRLDRLASRDNSRTLLSLLLLLPELLGLVGILLVSRGRCASSFRSLCDGRGWVLKEDMICAGRGTTGAPNRPRSLLQDSRCVYDAMCSCVRRRKIRTLQITGR
jgi:hypothetical protein